MSRHEDLRNQLINKNLTKFKLYYLFYFFAQGCFGPFYSLYLKEQLSFNETMIGNIMSISPFVNIMFQPLWGYINDKFNLNKKLVSTSLIIVCLFEVLILSSNSYQKILVLTVLYGIINCLITPIQDSISIKFTKKYRYNYANIRIYGSIGWAVATFVAGYSIDHYSYQSLKFLIIGAFIISFFLFLRVKNVRVPNLNKNRQNGSYKELFKNKTFLLFLVFAALSIGVFNSLGTFYNLRINAAGGATSVIGYITTGAVILEIMTIKLFTTFNRRFSDFSVLIFAVCLQIPILITFAFSNQLKIMLFMMLIKGVYQGFQISVMMNFIGSILNEKILTKGIILYSSISVGLTSSILINVGGKIASSSTINMTFKVYLILVFSSLLIALILKRQLLKIKDNT
jgi:MFS transporter, PPP family, 3-phenylpropionic acid transporter